LGANNFGRLQPVNSFFTRQLLSRDFALKFNIRTIKFVDRAAKALPVLLSELRQLRPDQGKQQTGSPRLDVISTGKGRA